MKGKLVPSTVKNCDLFWAVNHLTAGKYGKQHSCSRVLYWCQAKAVIGLSGRFYARVNLVFQINLYGYITYLHPIINLPEGFSLAPVALFEYLAADLNDTIAPFLLDLAFVQLGGKLPFLGRP